MEYLSNDKPSKAQQTIQESYMVMAVSAVMGHQ